jgi:hypothetical protein
MKFLNMFIGGVVWLSAIVTITLLCVSLFANCAKADVLVGGWTKHFDSPDPEFGEPESYNEKNYMVGVQGDTWALVVFKNSYNETSTALFARHEVDINRVVSTFVMAGVASGYQESDLPKQGEFAAMAFVGLDFHLDDTGIVVIGNQHLVNIGLRVKF